MRRTPENCSHRIVNHAADNTAAVCDLLSHITGVNDRSARIVQRDACEACCDCLRNPEQINPVIASLVYSMASRIVATGGHPECSTSHATALMQRVSDQLSVIMREVPERCFPPEIRPQIPESRSFSTPAITTFRWATAMLTAPRRDPRIEQTLDSLNGAGFGNIHIFAEPDAWIPDRYRDLQVTRRPRRFGNFLNFYSSLCTLLEEFPYADAYAVFQDDIELATGLRLWCEDQLWPLDNGIVSLFTPRLHSERMVNAFAVPRLWCFDATGCKNFLPMPVSLTVFVCAIKAMTLSLADGSRGKDKESPITLLHPCSMSAESLRFFPCIMIFATWQMP
jgi:hypothetical protein